MIVDILGLVGGIVLGFGLARIEFGKIVSSAILVGLAVVILITMYMRGKQ